MSASPVKGLLEVEFKTDRFDGPAKKAAKTIEKLGSTGEKSLNKIKRSADSTSQKFTSMGTRAKQSLDKISQSSNTAKQSVASLSSQGQQSMATLGGAGTRAGGQITVAMNQATSSVRQLNLATNQATVSNGTLVLGIAALGTSVGTTFTGMSNLNKAHLKQDKAVQKVSKVTVGLARANDLLSSTQLAVQRFTISITSMEEKGLQSTSAYTIAKANLTLQLQKLKTAQDDYTVKLADIKIAENDALQVADDLQDTYINMTISLANTGLMSAFLAKTMMPNLSRAMLVNKAAIIANSRVLKFLGFDLQKARVILATTKVSFIGTATGAKAFTFSLTGLRLGIRATMAAMGPIGLALIGIGIAFEVWETNAFGVQEKLTDLWNLLKEMVPFFAGLNLIVETVFPKAHAEVEEFGETVDTATESIDEFNTALNPEGTTAFTAFGNSIETTTSKLTPFINGVFDATGKLIDLNDRVGNTNGVYRKWQETINGFNAGLAIETITITKNTGAITKNTKAAKENAKILDDLKKNENQLTRKALVTREFFDSLPPELRKNLKVVDDKIIPKRRGATLGATSQALLSTVRKAGFNLGIAGFGSRNTKSQKDATIRAGFSSADFSLAQRLGLVHRGGIQRRSAAFRRISLGNRAGANARAIFEQAGVSIPSLPRRLFQGFRGGGNSDLTNAIRQRNREAQQRAIQAAFAEANKRVSLLHQIRTLDKTALPLTIRDSSFLQNLLSQATTRVTKQADILGITTDQVSSILSSSRSQDITNRIAFENRIILEANAV